MSTSFPVPGATIIEPTQGHRYTIGSFIGNGSFDAVLVWLTENEIEEFREAAERARMDVSRWVRDRLRRAVKREQNGQA